MYNQKRYLVLFGGENMRDKKTVAVLFGGQSFEHEVSRVSAQSVIENLDAEKYDIIPIGITKEGKWIRYKGDYSNIGSGKWESIALEELCNKPESSFATSTCCNSTIRDFLLEFDKNKNIDVIFPVLHGSNGEDGTIQGLLELAGIPYVGCGVLSSAVGMDKATSKILFENAGIPQGNFLLVIRSEINENIRDIKKRTEETIGYPCFVKPSNAGSSVGVSKVNDSEGLLEALLIAGKYDRRILIEEFINGREIECAVLGNDSPVASPGFVSYPAIVCAAASISSISFIAVKARKIEPIFDRALFLLVEPTFRTLLNSSFSPMLLTGSIIINSMLWPSCFKIRICSSEYSPNLHGPQLPTKSTVSAPLSTLAI
jgi:D-alanine--D-alanine ligase